LRNALEMIIFCGIVCEGVFVVAGGHAQQGSYAEMLALMNKIPWQMVYCLQSILPPPACHKRLALHEPMGHNLHH